jgi:type VI secretion system protein ImpB
MAKKEGSVAPKERINIRYKPATGNMAEDVELPLKLLFIGDYTGRHDPRALEDRKPINIDKDNFEQVLAEQNLSVELQVKDELSGEKDSFLNVQLGFKKLSDFGPVAVAQQVPELRRLLELRNALSALKGPLGNVPAFRKKIQTLLADKDRREALVRELGISSDDDKSGGK